jgi:hypothetical protein
MSTVTSGADSVRPALPSGIRAPLATAGVVGAVVAVTLGVVFAGQTTGSGLDGRVAAALELPHPFSSLAYTVNWVVQSLSDPISALHYPTDTVAGFCVALAVVPAAAWCTDLVGKSGLEGSLSGTPAAQSSVSIEWHDQISLVVAAQHVDHGHERDQPEQARR